MRKLAIIISLIVAIFSVGSVIENASYTEIFLPGGLPVGNVLAAAGLCSLATTALLLSLQNTLRYQVSRGLLIASILWLPASVVLAGNLSLNFQGLRGTVWLFGSAILASSVLLMLAWALGSIFFGIHKRSRAA